MSENPESSRSIAHWASKDTWLFRALVTVWVVVYIVAGLAFEQHGG